ncbi:MAG: ATP-binding protein [Collimonas sp.]|uniref:sensor histidine kinase n=1 Tax=Collimonas sp. TaxID=1963772 RepID=UPI003262F32B
MPRSLSARLLLSTAITLLVIDSLVFTGLAAVLHWGPQAVLRKEIEGNSNKIKAALRFSDHGNPTSLQLDTRTKYIYSALNKDAIFRILDENGKAMIASDDEMAPLVREGMVFDPAQSYFALDKADAIMHVLTTAVKHGGHTFYVQIARSERFNEAMMDNNGHNSFATTIAVLLIVMLVFTTVVAITFRRMLKPLRDASEAAARIAPHNLLVRLSAQGLPTEITPLIDAFNNALDRLETGYRLQQEFLATAAHELKTPLALMRGQIELDGVADRGLLLKDLDHMARQVHQLLHLAEVSDPQNFVFEEIDASAMVRNASEHLDRLAQRLQVHVNLQLPAAPLLLRADQGGLFILVKNLLENAIHHAPAGSEVIVRVDAKSMSVQDHGIGIATEDMPMLFKRFWRGPHRRDDGAGLGLAICQGISLAHGWRIEVRAERPGAEIIVHVQR